MATEVARALRAALRAVLHTHEPLAAIERRSVLLVLPGPLRRGEGDFPRFSRYADAMLDEREFFIRKAIGWVLREVGKTRPRLVSDWLLPRASRASGVTMREAVKYLPAPQRQRLLAQRGSTRTLPSSTAALSPKSDHRRLINRDPAGSRAQGDGRTTATHRAF